MHTHNCCAGPHKAKPRRLPSSPAAHTPAPTPPPSAPHTPIPQQQGRPPLPKRALAAPPPSAPSANVNAANSTFNTTAFVAAPKSSLSKSATPSTYSASTTVGSQALIAVDDDPFAGSDGRDPFADFDEPAQVIGRLDIGVDIRLSLFTVSKYWCWYPGRCNFSCVSTACVVAFIQNDSRL